MDALRSAKLQPLTLLLLLAGVALVAHAILGVSLLRQRWESNPLSAQIGSAEATLAAAEGVQRDLAELPARLDTARRQLATVQNAFPSDLDSNIILQAILDYASESQVRVTETHIQPPAADPGSPDGGVTFSGYRVVGFDLEVEGTFERLLAFLAAIEQAAASTSRIGDFSLQQSPGGQVLRLEVLSYARLAADDAGAPEPAGDSSAAPANPSSGEGTEVPHE